MRDLRRRSLACDLCRTSWTDLMHDNDMRTGAAKGWPRDLIGLAAVVRVRNDEPS